MSSSQQMRSGLQDLLRLSRSPVFPALALKGFGTFASFIVTFVMARVGGASVTGFYTLAITTATLGSTLALAGLDQITVRAVGGDLRQGQPEMARAAVGEAQRFVGLCSVTLSLFLLAAVLATPIAGWIGGSKSALSLAALAIAPLALARISVSSLRGAGALVKSQLFDGPVQSGLLAIAALAVFVTRYSFSVFEAVFGYLLCVTISSLLAWTSTRRIANSWPISPERRYRNVALVGWPILIAVGTHAATDWVVIAQLGASASTREVGAFRVAWQIVTLIAVVMTTVESIVSSQFAGDFRVGDHKGAWRRHGRATLLLLAIAGPPVLACLFYAENILGLFGPAFVSAAGALRVMAVAQCVNIATGPIGGITIMSGRERTSLVLSLMGLVVAASTGLVLVPRIGLLGGAYAYAITIAFRNISLYLLARQAFRRSAN